ncbi:MAG: AlpA family phage regulatory protein [Magnetococcales bacterium]|nr:AlpA family phage regulatory protein [Magnetococcales bacterium]
MKTVLNSDKQPILESGFLRLHQVLEMFPVSSSTWWAGCRSGRFPPGVKLGPRTTAWRASDIKTLLENPGMTWNDKES